MSRVIFVETGGVKLDFLGGAFATGSATSHDFTGRNLGPNSGILVVVAGAFGSVLGVVNGVLVNGVAATEVVRTADATNGTAIFQIASQNGTGTVTLQASNGSVHWAIGLYRLRALRSSTAYDSERSSTSSISFDVQKLGAAILGAVTDTNPSSWPYTADYAQSNTPGGFYFSCVSKKYDAAQTPLSITNGATSSIFRQVGGSWR